MNRRDALVIGSRALAVLFSVWALAEVSYLPSAIYSFLHYADQGTSSSGAMLYWRHHYLMALGFLITRIVGYCLMAMWLYRCGPDIDQLLLPAHLRENAGQ